VATSAAPYMAANNLTDRLFCLVSTGLARFAIVRVKARHD
jgi:hypothetical protein